MIAGTQTTPVFARNKSTEWMKERLDYMGFAPVNELINAVDWDEDDDCILILGDSNPEL